LQTSTEALPDRSRDQPVNPPHADSTTLLTPLKRKRTPRGVLFAPRGEDDCLSRIRTYDQPVNPPQADSTTLLTPLKRKRTPRGVLFAPRGEDGCLSRIRTYDQPVNSRLLYH